MKPHSCQSLSASKINLSTLCLGVKPLSDILRVKVMGEYVFFFFFFFPYLTLIYNPRGYNRLWASLYYMILPDFIPFVSCTFALSCHYNWMRLLGSLSWVYPKRFSTFWSCLLAHSTLFSLLSLFLLSPLFSRNSIMISRLFHFLEGLPTTAFSSMVASLFVLFQTCGWVSFSTPSILAADI